jgi:MoxR-like ATPase
MPSTLTPTRQVELQELFAEFTTAYLQTKAGSDHAAVYDTVRDAARGNYQWIVARAARGEEITDALLLKLLPHAPTPANRARGAWLHLAPAIMGDIRRWYEAAGWVSADEWPAVAQLIWRFIQRTVEDPTVLPATCAEFSLSPFAKGFQSGLLTPILNALRPEHFALFNQKTRTVLNYFTGANHSHTLDSYPAANAAMLTFAALLPPVENIHVGDLNLLQGDLLDIFCHWLVSVRRYPFRTPRTWRLAIHPDEWQWQDWQDGNYIAIGWDALGDLQGISRTEFVQRSRSLAQQYANWSQREAGQAWRFARQVKEGDQILIYTGDRLLLGAAMVTGPYYYVGGTLLGHRYPVEWLDRSPRMLEGVTWRGAFMPVDAEQYEQLLQLPILAAEALTWPAESDNEQSGSPAYLRYWPPVLAALQAAGGVADPKTVVEQVLEAMASDVQTVGAGGDHSAKRKIYRARQALIRAGFMKAGSHGVWQLTAAGRALPATWEEAQKRYHDSLYRQENAASLATASPAIRRLVESAEQYAPPAPQATPAIMAECAALLGVTTATIEQWLRALLRKGQMIFSGPPGAGKTYTARTLAAYLAGQGDGFWELVQFHPAYSYEDFIQGLRPITQQGNLTYQVQPGRFLEFCHRAIQRRGSCVLVLDEINRTHLAGVFGELLYLLEYRQEQVRLAGSGATFSIPDNVYLIGTMNSADRSIALVDHALRRRFAFVQLEPNYTLLTHYLAAHAPGFPAHALVSLLEEINQTIQDPNYAIGVSYFLNPDLAGSLRDIWQMEIEPYLEEYFWQQPARIAPYRWHAVCNRLQVD